VFHRVGDVNLGAIDPGLRQSAIEQSARARWDNWANPEWIGYAARAFHQASPPAPRAEYQGGGSRRGD